MPGLGADTEFQIPTGYSPPLAIVTEDDHTAWIMVASALGLACTLLFGGIRVFVRSTICPGIGMDDIFLAGATVSVPLLENSRSRHYSRSTSCFSADLDD